jgi:pyruvate/2-oxoglutarate dehydrogenase complex dihydrolipoamide acyltransferase (E2) component
MIDDAHEDSDVVLPPRTAEDVSATSVAQATAEDLKVDLTAAAVLGTGKGGKVTKADVEAAAPGTD